MWMLFVLWATSIWPTSVWAAPFPQLVSAPSYTHYDPGYRSGYFHIYREFPEIAVSKSSQKQTTGFPVATTQATQASRRVDVYLPRGWHRAGNYPVVYFNDGANIFFNGGGFGSWDVAGTLDTLAQKSGIIVVAVYTNQRACEYDHRCVAPGQTRAEVLRYSDFLADVLQPFLQQRYGASLSPSQHVMVGASLGGLSAFVTGVVRADAFGVVVALSPSFWVGAHPNRTLLASPQSVLNLVSPHLMHWPRRPKIWMNWGVVNAPGGGSEGQVIIDRGEEMSEVLLLDYGYSATELLFAGSDPWGGHNERRWGGRFKYVLGQLWERGVLQQQPPQQ